MLNNTSTVTSCREDVSHDIAWGELYPSLLSFVRHLIFSCNVSSWYGQEEDIVEDIVQETMRRLIERLQQAERGERPPIQSLKAMMFIVARNCCLDMRRRDLRLTRTSADEPTPSWNVNKEKTPYMDVAVENAFQEALFLLIACEIAHFPRKLGRALLIDLVERMAFDEEPTQLQKAFLEVGIQLQDYQNILPDHPRKRRNHAALLYYAYKRIAQLPSVQEYVFGTAVSELRTQKLHRAVHEKLPSRLSDL
jgi:DNA-directed RNA polymerase specialized sigma24 family protein